MQMQLDLDESEADYYENVANALSEKIDRITEEMEGLRNLCEVVQIERETLIVSIEVLKMESNSKDEEVRNASKLIDNMKESMSEKDELLNKISLERDEAVALIENLDPDSNSNTMARIANHDNELLAQLELAESKIHVRQYR